jgi:hypothetical protein
MQTEAAKTSNDGFFAIREETPPVSLNKPNDPLVSNDPIDSETPPSPSPVNSPSPPPPPPPPGSPPPYSPQPNSQPYRQRSGINPFIILVPIFLVLIAAVGLAILLIPRLIDNIGVFGGEGTYVSVKDDINGPGPNGSSDPHAPNPFGSVPVPVLETIPAMGGTVHVIGTTDFLFSPNESGMWQFRTSNNSGDPVLTIYNSYDQEVAYDDDGVGDLNSLMTVYLNASELYTLNAGFFATGTGSYTLTVSRGSANTEIIPGGGGTVQIIGDTSLTFTPNNSGAWEFRTSNNNGDPLLTLYNASGMQIAYDDDGTGTLNSLISIYLDAGTTYVLNAGFYDNGTGSYTLNVSASRAETIPGGGGNIYVSGATMFLFTPDTSGEWELRTSNNNGDPLLILYNGFGSEIARDDDSGGNYNSLIRHYLNAGETYTINAGFWNDESGSYSLSVSQGGGAGFGSTDIPGTGGSVSVSRATDYIFIPETTGMWEIRTSSISGDPLLSLYNSYGILIASDDDSGGGLDSLIRQNLIAGQAYTINAGFWNNGSGLYTLTVRPEGSVGEIDNALVGRWEFVSGTGPYIYYFMTDGEIEFTANGRVTEYAYGEPGTYSVSGNNLIVYAEWEEFTHYFTYVISGNLLTITDRDGDTGTWRRR